MSRIFFLKQFNKLESASQKILKDFYEDGGEIMVKLHFGEPGNQNALFPKDVEPIVKALKALKLKPVLLDTPVTYPSPRNTVKGYNNVVKDRGYEKLAPFIISDNYKKIKTKNFTAEVCKELIEAKKVLVISHVKGHGCAGFGGAIKNFGMGGVSKVTKGIEHDLSKPIFVSECQGCGRCAKLCPAKAIDMTSGKAKFNLSQCFGCSICCIECPYKCLRPKGAIFDDLLAQGASAVINNLPNETYYINLLKNISKGCDCENSTAEIISPDIGVLFSDNPVAIDKASVDLIKRKNGEEVFEKWNHKNPLEQIRWAGKYTKWGQKYKVLNYDY
jgi:uncharacterized Fe-S center protein